MGNAVYPAVVRGLTWTVLKTLGFNTIEQSAPNAYATYISQSSNPVWSFQLVYDFLKDFDIQLAQSQLYTDLRLLMGFFGARRGKWDDFLFLDPTDNFVGPGVFDSLPNTQFAELQVVTDGAGNSYSPVQRAMGGQLLASGTFVEDITDLKPVPNGPYGNATGAMTFTSGHPLGNWTFACKWSNWLFPTLPSDAVVQGIYPVIVCSFVHDRSNAYLEYGSGYDAWAGTGGGAGVEFPYTQPFVANFSSTEFYGMSIGTTPAALTNELISARLFETNLYLGPPPQADAMTITNVGFAVYYTTATTPAAPLFAAPFTIPTGQGCAYALPLTAEAHAAIIGYPNGSATATPSTQPTTQIFVYDNGVLQVAGTDYALLGPGLAIPGASFMGMYLHWLHTPTGPVTAEFNFYFRVRFDTDMQDFENWANNWWTIGGSNGSSGSGYIKLKTSRPNPL